MDKKLELFLNNVEGYLKNMPISERIDVIKELKSSIEELQLNDALTADEIIERLGSPKELAVQYLGDTISRGNSFHWKKVMMMISFYSLTSLSGMFILSSGPIIAGTFMLCGIIMPIIGMINTVGFLMGYDLLGIQLQIGYVELHPLFALPVTIIMGILLFIVGKVAWIGVIRYMRSISSVKRILDRKLGSEL